MTIRNFAKNSRPKRSLKKLKNSKPQAPTIKGTQRECFPERCPVKEAIAFLSGAWTPEIYWNLRQGPLRFGELQRAVGNVSAKVLTQRLRHLEDLGVIDRFVKPTSPPQVTYSLTALGQSFSPILESIADVGKKLIRQSMRQ